LIAPSKKIFIGGILEGSTIPGRSGRLSSPSSFSRGENPEGEGLETAKNTVPIPGRVHPGRPESGLVSDGRRVPSWID
jgi:hypothetical protein